MNECSELKKQNDTWFKSGDVLFRASLFSESAIFRFLTGSLPS